MFTIDAMLVAICCRIRLYCVAFRGARNAQFWGRLKMALDANGEWDGICACGKAAMDGVRCKYGATHEPRKQMPWEPPVTLTKHAFPWNTHHE